MPAGGLLIHLRPLLWVTTSRCPGAGKACQGRAGTSAELFKPIRWLWQGAQCSHA